MSKKKAPVKHPRTRRRFALQSLALAAACAGMLFAGGPGADAQSSPAPASGGDIVYLDRVRFDPTEGACVYTLPERALVRVRFGVRMSCLLCTPVDWRIQEPGEHRIPFDCAVGDQPLQINPARLMATVQTCALPKNFTPTRGAEDADFERLAALSASQRAARSKTQDETRSINPFWRNGLAREPGFTIEFRNGTETEPNTYFLPEQTVFRIKLPEREQATRFTAAGAELTIYVDFVLLEEEDAPATGTERKLSLASVPPGEHILTFNIRDPNSNVGAQSYRIHRLAEGESPPAPQVIAPHLR